MVSQDAFLLDQLDLHPGSWCAWTASGERLWLRYVWTPDLAESMGEDSGVWLTAEYGADLLPGDLAYAGAYGTGGGEFSEGEIGYTCPPRSARHVWFDFYATTDDDHRACRLTIDLATRPVQVDR